MQSVAMVPSMADHICFLSSNVQYTQRVEQGLILGAGQSFSSSYENTVGVSKGLTLTKPFPPSFHATLLFPYLHRDKVTREVTFPFDDLEVSISESTDDIGGEIGKPHTL